MLTRRTHAALVAFGLLQLACDDVLSLRSIQPDADAGASPATGVDGSGGVNGGAGGARAMESGGVTGAGPHPPFIPRTGAGGASPGIVLVPDDNGFFDGSNAAGVVGFWWSANDDYGSDNVAGHGSCPAAGFRDGLCSVLTTPTPGTSFRPGAVGRPGMCAAGISAQALPDGTGNVAWAAIWGNIIGFNLANPGTLADGTTLVEPYDAPAHGIIGFAFDIDVVPYGGNLRVEFPTTGTENAPPYWGAVTYLSPINGPGHYEMRWSEIGGPWYLQDPLPAFDPTKLEAIQFHVISNQGSAVRFDFCLSNVTLLTDGAPAAQTNGGGL